MRRAASAGRTAAMVLVLGLAARAAEGPGDDAMAMTRRAIELVDQGKTDEAIALLGKAAALAPDDDRIAYELAFAYGAAKRYDEGIARARALARGARPDPQFFQLLGNLLDDAGRRDEALAAYRDGLAKFPDSGPLYNELGIWHLRSNDRAAAVAAWFDGAQRDPGFPSCYYRLARAYADGDQPVWTLLFGEVFRNLEPDSRRSHELGALMGEVYRKGIVIGKGKASVSLANAPIDASQLDPRDPVPLASFVEIVTVMALPHDATAPCDKVPLSLDCLVLVRRNFVDRWFEMDKGKPRPMPLYDWQRRLQKAGLLDAYSYWLLEAAGPDEARGYAAAHPKEMTGLAAMMGKSRLDLPKGWLPPQARTDAAAPRLEQAPPE